MCTHTCIYTYRYTHARIQIHTYIFVHTVIDTNFKKDKDDTCQLAYMYEYMHTHIYTCMYIRTYK